MARFSCAFLPSRNDCGLFIKEKPGCAGFSMGVPIVLAIVLACAVDWRALAIVLFSFIFCGVGYWDWKTDQLTHPSQRATGDNGATVPLVPGYNDAVL